ncbi:hypothetical protein NPIL_48761 [Nephila pilipes]|uniref:Uncharacterized protein n=1 Tax=Nephila pilipes TaxID=299642 RepID=A0A8X6T7U2_NEPPI|nr:hypothetical protein NPIL_48761 [Nephila pilipes]
MSETEIFQLLHYIPETDFGSDEKLDLSDEEYIPEEGRESISADECSLFTHSAQNDNFSESENEEVSFINTNSQQASTS